MKIYKIIHNFPKNRILYQRDVNSLNVSKKPNIIIHIRANGIRKYKKTYSVNKRNCMSKISRTIRKKHIKYRSIDDDIITSQNIEDMSYDKPYTMKPLSLYDFLKKDDQKLIRKLIRKGRRVSFSKCTKMESKNNASSQYDFFIAECVGLAYAPRTGAVTEEEIQKLKSEKRIDLVFGRKSSVPTLPIATFKKAWERILPENQNIVLSLLRDLVKRFNIKSKENKCSKLKVPVLPQGGGYNLCLNNSCFTFIKNLEDFVKDKN